MLLCENWGMQMLPILMTVFCNLMLIRTVLEIFWTLQLADDLGFTIHKSKSVVVTTQQIVFCRVFIMLLSCLLKSAKV